jgi:tRNA (guanine37-N1)-methyltransferase
MRIEVLTIFPELFGPFLSTSLVGRAIARGLLSAEVRDLRDFALDRHRSVDDEPYGGGGGMVMMAPPWIRAVRGLAGAGTPPAPWRVLLSPQGARLDDAKVRQLAARGRLLLLCGRYEGIDERVRQTVVDEEVSIGDYVLSGGELPAMVLIDAVGRLVSGVLGSEDSPKDESFAEDLLEYPHYTRPAVFEGHEVPEVLLSGHHAEIERWRRAQASERTRQRRPDLLGHRER